MSWALVTLILSLIVFCGFCAVVEYVNRGAVKKEFVFTNSGYEQRIEKLEQEMKEMRSEK